MLFLIRHDIEYSIRLSRLPSLIKNNNLLRLIIRVIVTWLIISHGLTWLIIRVLLVLWLRFVFFFFLIFKKKKDHLSKKIIDSIVKKNH